jgi:hypothetical protein
MMPEELPAVDHVQEAEKRIETQEETQLQTVLEQKSNQHITHSNTQ